MSENEAIMPNGLYQVIMVNLDRLEVFADCGDMKQFDALAVKTSNMIDDFKKGNPLNTRVAIILLGRLEDLWNEIEFAVIKDKI